MNTLALLPNLAGGDGLLILLILLLFFGAKKLPELAKGLGSAVREFSKAKDEIEHELTRPPTPAPPRIEPPKETEIRKEADLREPVSVDSGTPREIHPHTTTVVEEVHDTTHAA